MLVRLNGAMVLSVLMVLLAIGGQTRGDITAKVDDSGTVVSPAQRADLRFAASNDETPSFQRHVSPLLGRLGCNGRSCHGSFQGQGGLRLSLFGYDFLADHQALLADGSGRVDLEEIEDSLILDKPTDDESHGGGKRFETGGWEYNLLRRWLAAGAPGTTQPLPLVKLEVEPAEILFESGDGSVALRVVAHWSDGTEEDVTPLCRFQSNDPQVATVDLDGQVSAGGFGDTHVVVFYDNGVTPVPVIRAFPQPEGTSRSAISEGRSEQPIDALVSQKLRKLNLPRSAEVDDISFLRRVYLDIAGTLPTPDEVRRFAADPSPSKRRDMIDALLETPAYAAWWTTFLCDMTGNNTRELRNASPAGNQASQQWYDWIRERVADNVPYDQIVAGIVVSASRSPDESYLEYCESMSRMVQDQDTSPFVQRPDMPYYWMRQETQDRETRAIGFAQNFLGVQIQCAQCHKHPFDRWSQADFETFSRFFSGVTVSQANRLPDPDKADLLKIYADLGIDPQTRGGNVQRMVREALGKGKTVPFPQMIVTRPTLTSAERKEAAEAIVAKMAAQEADGTSSSGQALNRDRRKNRGATRGPLYHVEGRLLGEDPVAFKGVNDVRTLLMNWMREEDNPYFARAFVNRVWARYFGYGIVNPVDDLNLANPASNQPLLDYLAQGFVQSGYDMKWLHREIANSRTYQSSWVPEGANELDSRNFSHAVPRRLPAEVVVDAVVFASSPDSTTKAFLSKMKNRAIAVPGTAGSPANVPGRNASFALDVFGRSTRSNNCDCDRSDETSLIQTVYLQNDQDVHFWLGNDKGWVATVSRPAMGADGSANPQMNLRSANERLKRLEAQRKTLTDGQDPERSARLQRRIATLRKQKEELEAKLAAISDSLPSSQIERVIEEAYLRTLSRFPEEIELARCRDYLAESRSLRDGLTGIMWALINTKEFIVNH